MTNADPLDRDALGWFVRNQAGDDAGFDAWRAADPRHDSAYARIERLWRSDAFGAAASRVPVRRTRAVVAAALSVALVLGLGGATLRLHGIAPGWPSDHATRIGTIAETRLDDGTRLVLDSGSAADVAFGAERVITLRAGRILVDVAADKRPLAVHAGDMVIRDIGTRFSVERRGDAVLVAVADGAVELRADGRARMLRAGQRGGIGGAIAAVDEPRDFGWTRHRLYFSDRPLGDIADELRRYHRGWIFVANDRVAATRISGGLSLDDPAAAMAELARLGGGTLTRVSDHILILR
jgi:transmembrane sensor